jgi:putative redox protein
MRFDIESGGLRLAAHLFRPPQDSTDDTPAVGVGGSAPLGTRGLVLCHGFPAGPGGSATSGQTYPEFGERLAADTGWTVLTFNFRGSGGSEGNFSLSGWLTDLRAAIDHLLTIEPVTGVWLAGAGTGGALTICAAAEDERVRGVAALAAHADFRDWAVDPEAFLEHTRTIGVVRDADFPPDMDLWARELMDIRPIVVIGKVPPRPILLVHGGDDDIVHVQDARWLADATDGKAELRIVPEAGHRLRHDPRAVAILIGWLERQLPV